MLTTKEQKQIEELEQFTRQVLGADESGHDMQHIDRVVRMTQKIATTEPTTDFFVATLAALLHDTYDEKLVANVVEARQITSQRLKQVGVQERQVQAVLAIIDNMSWSKQQYGDVQPLTLTGQVVQDADRLDAIGAIGIVRTLQYGQKHHRVLYDPSIQPGQKIDYTSYRREDNTTLNHFYEKLFLIAEQLNTEAAKQIGVKRQQLMRDFVKAIELEW